MPLAICQDVVVDAFGNAIANASIEVRRESDNGLAAIFKDRSGLFVSGNPVYTDADGFFSFFAEAGAYKLIVSHGGSSKVVDYVAVGLMQEYDGTAAGRTLINSTVGADSVGNVIGVKSLTFANGSKLHDYADPTSDGGNYFAGVLAGNFTNGPGGGASHLGSGNTGVGRYVLGAMTTAYYCTGTGEGALASTTTGFAQTANGQGALQNGTSSNYSTAIGWQSQNQVDICYANTSGGAGSLLNLHGGDGVLTACRNSVWGVQAMINATIAYSNSVVGTHGFNDLLDGAFNCGLGQSCGYSNVSGNSGLYLGRNSGFFCLGSNVIFIGDSAGYHETAGNCFYLNPRAHTDLAADKKYSMFYGTFASASDTLTGQNLYINVQKLGIGTIGAAAVGQLSMGLSSVPAVPKTYIDTADQGVIDIYAPANFPAAGNYNRMMDIVCGSSTVKSAIRFGISNAGAGSLTFPVYIFNSGMIVGENYVAAFYSPPAGGMLIETQLGVGVTSPSAQLHTSGTVRFANFGAGTMYTDASGNVSVTCDRELKEDFEPFTRGREALRGLIPQSYRNNEMSGLDRFNRYVAHIAQDLQIRIPEAIGRNGDGYLTVSDRAVLCTHTNALVSLDEDVIALQRDIAGLTARLAAAGM